MNQRKKRGRLIIIWTLVILLIVSAATAGTCLYLACQDDYQSQYSVSQDDNTLMYTALKGAIFGEAFTLTEAQVNTYLYDEIVNQSDSHIQKFHVYFQNDIAEIYAKVHYLNLDLGFYSKAKLSLDTVKNVVSVQLYDAKLGRLPISESVLKNIVSQNIKESNIVSVRDGVIDVKSSYDFNINSFTLNLTFQNLTVEDGSITCQTNSLAGDALHALADALKTPEGREKLKELFHVAFSAESLSDLGLDRLDRFISGLNDIKDKIISRFSDESS